MITGFVIALADEIKSLTNKKISKGDCILINDKALVAFSGAGPENARRASQLLIDKGAQRLVSWGCAAALEETLKPGDLVIPKKLITQNLDLIMLDSEWQQSIISHYSNFSPNTELLAESPHIVGQSDEKKTIHQLTKAVALDMESIAVAKTANQHKIPSLVVRTIADPVNMSLPRAVSYALNNQGDVELRKLLFFLLTHPTELPGLIILGMHFNAARNKLKLLAKQLDIIVGFEQNTAIK